MKKIFITLFCLSISFTLLSQKKKQYAEGKISYRIKIAIDKNLARHKVLLSSFPRLGLKIETAASEFDFSLVFNDSISMFYLEKNYFLIIVLLI